MVRTTYLLCGEHVLAIFTCKHTDINECAEGTHECEHNCHNTIGSYTCSCRTGYSLNADGRACDGKVFAYKYEVIFTQNCIETFQLLAALPHRHQ